MEKIRQMLQRLAMEIRLGQSHELNSVIKFHAPRRDDSFFYTYEGVFDRISYIFRGLPKWLRMHWEKYWKPSLRVQRLSSGWKDRWLEICTRIPSLIQSERKRGRFKIRSIESWHPSLISLLSEAQVIFTKDKETRHLGEPIRVGWNSDPAHSRCYLPDDH